ncbi:uncharacterized protein [Littorina saxatilis]|uniref:uncharacterized protein n=1 Tax=Littorina saxatilis TaxID=31220 RepID=UPI0038B662D5
MDQAHMDANYGGGFTYSGPTGAAPPTLAHAQPAPAYPLAYPPAYPPAYPTPPAYPSNVVMPAQQITPEMMMQAQMSAMMMMQAQLSPQKLTSMSPVPVNVKCPFCQVQMTTETEKVLGARGKVLICAFTCMW